MDDATMQKGLTNCLKSLSREPQSLDDVWLGYQLFWQDIGWQKAQLKLWLYCHPKVTRDETNSKEEQFSIRVDKHQASPDLAEEIAKIIQANGRPMPLAQLKNRLPAGVLATDPMLKAAIASHPGLEMTGPLVKLS